jgi:hypothetical protein
MQKRAWVPFEPDAIGETFSLPEKWLRKLLKP